ncbi:MAG: hypothetical protein NTY73_02275, partial [Candidatus Micrarchaeota archaeon]|nr:hypothetical protein [Candidatus Micrarchaeota archaeon]
ACSDSRLKKTGAANSIFLVLLAGSKPDSLTEVFSSEEVQAIGEGKLNEGILGKSAGDFGGMVVNAGAVAKPELAKGVDVIVIGHDACGAHKLGEHAEEILGWLRERGYDLSKLGVNEKDFMSIPESDQHVKEQVQKLVDTDQNRRVVGVVVNFGTGTARVVVAHKVKMPSQIEIPNQKIQGELLKSQAPKGIVIGSTNVDLQKAVGAGLGEYFAVTDDKSLNSKISLIYAVAHLNKGNNIKEVVFVARKEGEANELMESWRANPLFADLEKSGVKFLAKVAAGS